jgi:hypothetical protein
LIEKTLTGQKLSETAWLPKLAFLSDIFVQFNTEIQSKNQTIVDSGEQKSLFKFK